MIRTALALLLVSTACASVTPDRAVGAGGATDASGASGGASTSTGLTGSGGTVARVPIVDVHSHLSPAMGDFESPADDALLKMQEQGIERTIVMAPPFSPDNPTIWCFDTPAFASAIAARPALSFLGGGGTLNPLIQQTILPDGGIDAAAVAELRPDFATAAQAIVASGAAGFGELTALHISFAEWHDYEAAPADHPFLRDLADIAAAASMPIDLHMEAMDRATMPPICNIDSTNNPCAIVQGVCECDISPTLPAFEGLLAHNRSARIVWDHIGWDNTGAMTLERLQTLVGRHDNLYLQLRGAPSLAFPEHHPLDGGVLRPEWLAFMRNFPDRFIIANDHFYTTAGPGSGNPKPNLYATARVLIDAIAAEDAALAARVARDNALDLYRGLR